MADPIETDDLAAYIDSRMDDPEFARGILQAATAEIYRLRAARDAAIEALKWADKDDQAAEEALRALREADRG